MKKYFLFIPIIFMVLGCDIFESNQAIKACYTYKPDTNIYVEDPVYFSNCSNELGSFRWDFGDNQTSTDQNPVHRYESAGSYRITLVARLDESSDSTIQDIVILNPVKLPERLLIDTLAFNSDFKKIDKVVSASLMTATLKQYKIDINGDLIDDLEFSASGSSSHIGQYWSSGIRTLDPGITIDIVGKTELFAKYSETKYTVSNDSVTIVHIENYNRNKTYPSNLKIDTILGFYPSIHSIGDTLNQSNNWKSGFFIFEKSSSEDQIFFRSYTSLGIWGNEYNKFIGIRYSKANNQYYGWIEVSVTNFEISLIRCYLQME